MDKETKRYLRKVAIKTAALTLAVFALFSAVFVLAFPKKSSDFLFNVGLKKTSCSLMETQYERSKDINDLSVLFDRAVDLSDARLLYKYGEEFLNHEYFEDYCTFRSSLSLINQKSYVEGNYAVGILVVEGVDKAIAYLEDQTSKSEYDIDCPYSYFSYYIVESYPENKVQDAQKIILSLDKIYIAMTKIEETPDLKRIVADAFAIAEKYDLPEKEVWQSRYSS